MAPSREETTLPATRRPRKSTGHSPVRKRMEKENITVDVASSLAGNGGRKKSRSKSMGPGGIDVLKSGNGNRRSVSVSPCVANFVLRFSFVCVHRYLYDAFSLP